VRFPPSNRLPITISHNDVNVLVPGVLIRVRINAEPSLPASSTANWSRNGQNTRVAGVSVCRPKLYFQPRKPRKGPNSPFGVLASPLFHSSASVSRSPRATDSFHVDRTDLSMDVWAHQIRCGSIFHDRGSPPTMPSLNRSTERSGGNVSTRTGLLLCRKPSNRSRLGARI